MKNDIDKRMIKAFSYSFLGAGVSKGLIMLLGILLARVLGEEEYGKYSLINSTIQTFVTFASMGIGASLVRYVAITRNKNKKLCGQYIGSFLVIIVGMSLLISSVVLICSDWISVWTAGDKSLSSLYSTAAIVILFVAISSSLQSVLLGFEEYKHISILEIVYGVIAVVVGTYLADIGGVIGAIIGLLISKVVYSLFLFAAAHRKSRSDKISWRIKFDVKIWKVYKEFTFPSFMSSVFVIPVSWVLNSMLTKSAGFFDMAVYSISVQWVSIVNYIMSLFTRAKPIYAQLYTERNFGEFERQLKRTITISAALGSTVAVIAALFSKFILGMYGEAYVEQHWVFVIMMIASAIISVQSQFGSVFEVIGKMWIGFMLNVVWASNLVILFMLLRQNGALGYAIAYMVSYGIHCFLSYLIVWNAIKKEKSEGK